MVTEYDIGSKIYIPAEVEEIHAYNNKTYGKIVLYKVHLKSAEDKDISFLVSDKYINGDSEVEIEYLPVK